MEVLGVDDEREADIEEEVDEDDDDEVNSTQVEKVKLITPQNGKRNRFWVKYN